VLLRRGALPAPLHLAGALARYPHLTLASAGGAARGARARAAGPARSRRSTELTFGEWLARTTARVRDAVAALWDLIALPTLNLPAAQASLALGAFVFRTGLLSGADAGDIGFPRGDARGDDRRARRAGAAAAGVEVRLGWRAERLEQTATGVEVHGRTGAEGEALEDRRAETGKV
jgi:hypothetical protein